MRLLIYTLLISLGIKESVQAQIKLIGVASNSATENIDIFQWTAFDSSSVVVTPTNLDAYFFASTAFDPFNSSYFISGISGQTTGLFSYNTNTNESNMTATSLNTNIAEFDMRTSKMYNLLMGSAGNINIYEYDIALNQNSLIGTIYEPGITSVVADAICFDSNNGILYYVGYTSTQSLALYAIPVRENSFSYTRTILNTLNSLGNITSLNFDNVNEKIFAANDTFDQNGNSTGRNIVEISISTGEVTTIGQLNEFDNFLASSSLFDQNSGTFLLVGITNNNLLKMIAFDTYTNTYVTGFVPDNVTEIACDNTMFARSRYSVSGIEPEASMNFKIYPNPATNLLNIESSTNGSVEVQIFSSSGKLVYEKFNTLTNKMDLDLSSISPGLYTVRLIDANQTFNKKIIIK